MALLVVSYPDLSPGDSARIERLRNEFTLLEHSVLPPHFTLVFPLRHMAEDTLTTHVAEKLEARNAIPFVLRSSLLVPDDEIDRYYVLLVPDEGFSGVVKLHDALYTGPLAEALRLDIPFVPHITLGYSADALYCKHVVDTLNSRDFAMSGTISKVEIVRKECAEASTVRTFQL